MANITPKAVVQFSGSVEFTEVELRALDAILGYSPKHFLTAFKKNLGEAYVKPHEAGVYSLHETIRPRVAELVHGIDAARKKLREAGL